MCFGLRIKFFSSANGEVPVGICISLQSHRIVHLHATHAAFRFADGARKSFSIAT